MADIPNQNQGPPWSLDIKLLLATIVGVAIEYFTGSMMVGLSTDLLEATRMGRITIEDLGPVAAFAFGPFSSAYLSDVFGLLMGVACVCVPTGIWAYLFSQLPDGNRDIFHADINMSPGLKIAIGVAVTLALLDMALIYNLFVDTTPRPQGMPGPGLFATIKALAVSIILVTCMQTLAFFTGALLALTTRNLTSR